MSRATLGLAAAIGASGALHVAVLSFVPEAETTVGAPNLSRVVVGKADTLFGSTVVPNADFSILSHVASGVVVEPGAAAATIAVAESAYPHPARRDAPPPLPVAHASLAGASTLPMAGEPNAPLPVSLEVADTRIGVRGADAFGTRAAIPITMTGHGTPRLPSATTPALAFDAPTVTGAVAAPAATDAGAPDAFVWLASRPAADFGLPTDASIASVGIASPFRVAGVAHDYLNGTLTGPAPTGALATVAVPAAIDTRGQFDVQQASPAVAVAMQGPGNSPVRVVAGQASRADTHAGLAFRDAAIWIPGAMPSTISAGDADFAGAQTTHTTLTAARANDEAAVARPATIPGMRGSMNIADAALPHAAETGAPGVASATVPASGTAPLAPTFAESVGSQAAAMATADMATRTQAAAAASQRINADEALAAEAYLAETVPPVAGVALRVPGQATQVAAGEAASTGPQPRSEGPARTELLPVPPQTALDLYRQGLRSHVRRALEADRAALSTGAVVLALDIAAGGTLRHAALAESSGNPEFDEEILRIVRRAAPFLPVPAELGRDGLALRFTFTFEGTVGS